MTKIEKQLGHVTSKFEMDGQIQERKRSTVEIDQWDEEQKNITARKPLAPGLTRKVTFTQNIPEIFQVS